MDTDTAWEQWGARDPYYGVLTSPRFRVASMTPEGKKEFFASGRCHIDYVFELIRKYGGVEPAPQRILDFGCGVGRLVVPFAERAQQVVGMDISTSMLAEARRNCDAQALTNVELVLSDDSLSAASGSFDLVHSCIVFQHIATTRGRMLFAELLRKMRPGAWGAIHVTFGWDVHAATFGQLPPVPPPPPPSLRSFVRRLLRRRIPEAPEIEALAPDPDPEMQMHYYNLSELTFILQQAGVRRVHSDLTDHGGAMGAFLVFQMPG